MSKAPVEDVQVAGGRESPELVPWPMSIEQVETSTIYHVLAMQGRSDINADCGVNMMKHLGIESTTLLSSHITLKAAVNKVLTIVGAVPVKMNIQRDKSQKVLDEILYFTKELIDFYTRRNSGCSPPPYAFPPTINPLATHGEESSCTTDSIPSKRREHGKAGGISKTILLHLHL